MMRSNAWRDRSSSLQAANARNQARNLPSQAQTQALEPPPREELAHFSSPGSFSVPANEDDMMLATLSNDQFPSSFQLGSPFELHLDAAIDSLFVGRGDDRDLLSAVPVFPQSGSSGIAIAATADNGRNGGDARMIIPEPTPLAPSHKRTIVSQSSLANFLGEYRRNVRSDLENFAAAFAVCRHFPPRGGDRGGGGVTAMPPPASAPPPSSTLGPRSQPRSSAPFGNGNSDCNTDDNAIAGDSALDSFQLLLDDHISFPPWNQPFHSALSMHLATSGGGPFSAAASANVAAVAARDRSPTLAALRRAAPTSSSQVRGQRQRQNSSLTGLHRHHHHNKNHSSSSNNNKKPAPRKLGQNEVASRLCSRPKPRKRKSDSDMSSGSSDAAAPLSSTSSASASRPQQRDDSDGEDSSSPPSPPLSQPHSATTGGSQHSAGKKMRANRFGAVQTKKWDDKYRQLCQFVEQYGHATVPLEYQINPALAHWVKRQRSQYKRLSTGRQSSMTPERVQKLEDVGFVWDSHKSGWQERWYQLEDFYKEHGHSSVPCNYPQNPALSVWIKCQRRQMRLHQLGRASNMNQERIDKLNSLEFVWAPRQNS